MNALIDAQDLLQKSSSVQEHHQGCVLQPASRLCSGTRTEWLRPLPHGHVLRGSDITTDLSNMPLLLSSC